jgi:hypothetical protein
MRVCAGSRPVPYEILEPIGMGIYQARDCRLDRLVAVNVSTRQVACRLEREAAPSMP